jgi:hypothetical protein
MRSLQLESALREYLDAAATLLQTEVTAGSEVRFEVGSSGGRGGRGTPLYCYRALTGEFIDAREDALRRLPAYGLAAKLLQGFEGLDRYLAASGLEIAQTKGRERVRLALKALLEDAVHEQTDFQLHPERLRDALERLERAAIASPDQLLLIATLHGVQISSPELVLAKGLTIARPDAIEGLPEALRASEDARAERHLLVLYSAEEEDPAAGIARGQEVLAELLRALRLFGDGRVSLGALAYARIGSGAFSPLAIAAGGRPQGMLVVAEEQEDELRAFCSLVSRRAPRRDELAWALRRFELGCDRESPHEGLSDYLLALRALLEPEGPASAMLAGRLAALCATPENRPALAERVLESIAIERDIVAGKSVKQASLRAHVEAISGDLRALLSDVICGHLDPDLVSLADELLLSDAERERPGPSEGDTDELEQAAAATDAGEAAAVLS